MRHTVGLEEPKSQGSSEIAANRNVQGPFQIEACVADRGIGMARAPQLCWNLTGRWCFLYSELIECEL
jgi:hypothetical protein